MLVGHLNFCSTSKVHRVAVFYQSLTTAAITITNWAKVVCDGTTYTHRHTHTLRGINLGLIDSPQPSGPCRPNNNSLTTGLFLPRPDLLPNVSKHTHIHTFTMSFLLGDGMYSLYVTYYRCRTVSRGSKVRPPIVSRSVWSFKAAHCSVAEK